VKEPSSLGPGARVGPYEIVALLGEGGMGQVYRARDERLSREVALKVVHADLAQDVERLRRFEHEAKAAGTLNHPNIVAVYDTGQHDGAPYIVSELLQGETLRDRIASGALGVRKAVDCGVQIARGLAAAHERGIVHRDLKPENLFLTRDGLVKILDFGIAKLGRAGEEKAGSDFDTLSHTGTSPGTMMGTVGYMSPEQVRGLPTDHRSDIFSFGTVLYEMLTGKRAFKGKTVADTLSAILREDPTEAVGTEPALAAALLRVVRRCLEKAPEDRFQSARDLAFALEGATAEVRIVAGEPRPAGRSSRAWKSAAAALAMAGVAAGLGLWLGRATVPAPTPAAYERLTFRLGRIESAHFAPDGDTILYSAHPGGESPMELFSTRATTRGERPLGLKNALTLAISSREELALLMRPEVVTWYVFEGTLARAPMAGGSPREVLEGVLDADWSPDGKDLAVIHNVGDRCRLEYPIGQVLYEPSPPSWMSDLRISPGGNQVGFIEHPVAADGRGGVSVVALDGQRRALASGFTALNGLGWSPNGNEIWFTATRSSGASRQVHAVSLSGRERLLAEGAGAFQLFDVSRRGQILGAQLTVWTEIRARVRGAAEEAELPAADLSFLADLSDDGTQILGTDTGHGGGPRYAFYLQRTDGSPPVWLGDGDGQAISPDGRSVLAVLIHTTPQQLIVVQTGAGEARTLEPGPVVRYTRAVFDPSGRKVVFSGIDGHDAERVFVQDLDAGPPRAVTSDDVGLPRIGRPVSPDGRRVVALGADGLPALYPLAGGNPQAVPSLVETDVPICWTPNGRELLVARYEKTPPRVEYVDVTSGRTRPWNRLGRAAPTGLQGQYRILATPNGESYAYSYTRQVNDLYLTSPFP
jgi:tRNA A-37 threonylcarbamoyl transferase component Bud32